MNMLTRGIVSIATTEHCANHSAELGRSSQSMWGMDRKLYRAIETTLQLFSEDVCTVTLGTNIRLSLCIVFSRN